ncbi:hypothetical protein LPJ61_004730 [Coemansia biformis]|uniref:P-loop containing nucleoside triphosphate hydrolase protein n=1 Tax=Coemansia biformis TaxID=1286918 RepID=A0A9W7Y8Q5_9FUNG|nr:hypothetical protein LPJ61_004730 [Coemansia biformis]
MLSALGRIAAAGGASFSGILGRGSWPGPLTLGVSTACAQTEQRRYKGGRKEKLGRKEQLARLQNSRHKMRVDSLKGKGRSGGGKTQLLESRVRRARDQKEKFAAAREFATRGSATKEEQSMAEARILLQRSRQLKSRDAPGMGFTPARFRLMPIDNESGTDLTALSCESAAGRKSMTARELKEQVDQSAFDTLGLHADVAAAAIELLEAQAQNRQIKDGSVRPTIIQALGIPEILGHTRIGEKRWAAAGASAGPNVFLAAETGSGKTLAYALPIVSQLKQEEEEERRRGGGKQAAALRRERRPRVLVVVPSRELVTQVTATFKSIGHKAKLRTVGVHLGLSRRGLREKAEQGPIDVMVATPGAVLRYMVKDPLFTPADVRRLVVDEADSMMDSFSFGDQISSVLDMVRKSNSTQGRAEQTVFVSATLPKLIREQIIRRCPDVIHVTTPLLHRAPPRLSQTFIDVSKDFQGQKLNALWSVLRTAAADKHVIIFCNSKTHANLVFRQLYRRGIPSLLLTGADSAKEAAAGRDQDAAADNDKEEEQEAATAAAARGRPPSDDPWEQATWFPGQDEVWAGHDDEHEHEHEQETESEYEDPGERPSEAAEEAGDEEPAHGTRAGDLQAPIPRFDRGEVLRAFLNSEPIPPHLLPAVAPAEADAGVVQACGTRKLLVCTDLASRGLDTMCVTHVVLFDFPTTAIDYLHRAGRTARAGGRGKVTALVGKRDRRLAEQIRLAIRQGGTIS